MSNMLSDPTADDLRTEVAEVLAVAADEIDDDDDLTDHGLTSLALVTLIESWTERGLEIDVADFLAGPTLSAVIARLP